MYGNFHTALDLGRVQCAQGVIKCIAYRVLGQPNSSPKLNGWGLSRNWEFSCILGEEALLYLHHVFLRSFIVCIPRYGFLPRGGVGQIEGKTRREAAKR